MRGRCMNEEWEHFERSVHGKGFKMECSFFSELASSKLSTMANHLAGPPWPNHPVHVASPSASSSISQLPPKRQATFQGTKEEQLKHDMQWARVVVSANLPFVIKRNPEMKLFCGSLRGPSLRLPSEKRKSLCLHFTRGCSLNSF